ncbi:hypothetical protein ROT00_14745 [Agromyces mediolanus]|uniref:hypothetical protein n=1 Tax=Agromyces mediolanus TaxID=41986 RepID=UPI003838C9EC
MRWFRRRRPKFKAFDRSALPEVQPPSVEEMIDEGVMLAESAGRMTLRNRFVVEALRGEDPYDDDRAAAAAREVLHELVQQADATAELSAEDRETAAKREGKAKHQHDYRRADTGNLRRREKVYAAVAKRLWELREDPEYLHEFATRARDEAWNDVAGAIEARLDREWPQIEVDAEYELARPQRMRELFEDLERAVETAELKRAEREDPFHGYVG